MRGLPILIKRLVLVAAASSTDLSAPGKGELGESRKIAHLACNFAKPGIPGKTCTHDGFRAFTMRQLWLGSRPAGEGLPVPATMTRRHTDFVRVSERSRALGPPPAQPSRFPSLESAATSANIPHVTPPRQHACIFLPSPSCSPSHSRLRTSRPSRHPHPPHQPQRTPHRRRCA